MNGEDVCHGLFEVVEDSSPHAHRFHDGREIIVEKNERGGLPRHVGSPPAHRDPDVRRLERGGVVHAVSRHGDDLAVRLERVHETELLLRHDAREDVHPSHEALELRAVDPVEIGACGDLVRRRESRLPGDGARGAGIVAGHHDHADARLRAFPERVRDPGPDRIGEADETEEPEGEIVLSAGESPLAETRLRDAEDPEASAGHRADVAGELLHPAPVEMAQIRDDLGGALRRDDELVPPGGFPNARYREQALRDRILVNESPIVVEMLGVREAAVAEPLEGLFHRIEGIALARENREFDELVERLRKRLPARAAHLAELAAREELGHGHLVPRERPRLVDAENGRGSERLDHGHVAGEDAAAREVPGAEGEKDREDHGELLRQYRHRERDAGEQSPDPVAPRQGVRDDDDGAENEPDDGEVADDAARFPLQGRVLALQGRERPADHADFRIESRGRHLDDPLPPHHHRSRINEGQPVAARTPHPGGAVPDALVDRDRLPGEQRLVGREAAVPDDRAVGGNAIPLGEDDRIAADHLPSRDAPFGAAPDDERARARQVPQGLERSFGLPLLIEGDRHDDEDEAEEHEPLRRVPEREIDGAAGDEQEEHRLAGHAEGDARHRTARRRGQLVRPVAREPARGLLLGEPRDRIGGACAGSIAHGAPGARRAAGGRKIATCPSSRSGIRPDSSAAASARPPGTRLPSRTGHPRSCKRRAD